jgi:hypothetical protein
MGISNNGHPAFDRCGSGAWGRRSRPWRPARVVSHTLCHYVVKRHIIVMSQVLSLPAGATALVPPLEWSARRLVAAVAALNATPPLGRRGLSKVSAPSTALPLLLPGACESSTSRGEGSATPAQVPMTHSVPPSLASVTQEALLLFWHTTRAKTLSKPTGSSTPRHWLLTLQVGEGGFGIFPLRHEWWCGGQGIHGSIHARCIEHISSKW